MPNVVRFALDSARDQYVSGVGFFRDGILDVDANRLQLVAKARYLVQPYRAVEIGTVDSATPKPNLPAPQVPPAPNTDPFPQYLTPAELPAAMAAFVPPDGSPFAVAQRAAFDGMANNLGLRDGRRGMARLEAVGVAPNSTKVLANLTGSGTVSHLWMAIDSFGTDELYLHSRLRVYADGATTPDVDVDLGTLFAVHEQVLLYDEPTAVRRWSCGAAEFDQGQGRKHAGFNLHLPIPFRNGLRIEWVNTGGQSGTLYSQVFYDEAPPAPVVLRSAGRVYANRLTLAATDTYDLLNLPDGDGWLVYTGYCGDGSTGNGSATWLERDWEVYVGGESTPSIASTGTEDWFLGAFYYQDQQGISTPWTMVGINNFGRTSQAVDLRGALGGIRFTNGVRVHLGTEAACNTSHAFSYCLLYYVEV